MSSIYVIILPATADLKVIISREVVIKFKKKMLLIVRHLQVVLIRRVASINDSI